MNPQKPAKPQKPNESTIWFRILAEHHKMMKTNMKKIKPKRRTKKCIFILLSLRNQNPTLLITSDTPIWMILLTLKTHKNSISVVSCWAKQKNFISQSNNVLLKRCKHTQSLTRQLNINKMLQRKILFFISSLNTKLI